MRGPSDISTVRPGFDLGAVGLDAPAVAAVGPSAQADSDKFKGVRRLIWLYFWLLMTEGLLRKWILPGLANPLLVVRDPVLLLCYFVALRKGAFPRTAFLPSILMLSAVAALFSAVGLAMGASRSNYIVLLFGVRACFLHLPLIFLIGRVFTRRDVEEVGRWLLWMAPPMIALVYLQYRAPSGAWVNAGAGLGAEQIGVAIYGSEKIRPPGIFSYNTGLTAYLSLVAAFLAGNYLAGGKTYKRWLAWAASTALVASVPLAISRSTVGALVVVAFAAVICLFFRPELVSRGLILALVLGVGVLIVGRFSFSKEGLGILSARFEEGAGIKVGIIDRTLERFTKPVEILASAPFLGAGIGVGTTVGAKILTGRAQFLLSEDEWDRNVDEMGPLVGLLYILLRIALTGYLTFVAWKSLRRGSTLSFLLLSAGALSILNGNFAQATSLGFAVFTGGLCLAAAKDPEGEKANEPEGRRSEAPSLSPKPVSAARVRGRSRYAEELHGARRTA